MATYFRLAVDSATVPTHWAYGDPWERHEHVIPVSDTESEIDVEIVDCRVEGFQAWSNLANVFATLAGANWLDGDYPADEYPHLILVDADKVGDGGGEWVNVTDFRNARQVDSQDFVDWVRDQIETEELEALVHWVDEHEDAVFDWLNSKAKATELIQIDTLGPCPYED